MQDSNQDRGGSKLSLNNLAEHVRRNRIFCGSLYAYLALLSPVIDVIGPKILELLLRENGNTP